MTERARCELTPWPGDVKIFETIKMETPTMRLFETVLSKNLSRGMSLKMALGQTATDHPELHQHLIERAQAGERIFFDKADQSQFTDFRAAVRGIASRENMSLAGAVRAAVDRFPALHKKYLCSLEGQGKDAHRALSLG